MAPSAGEFENLPPLGAAKRTAVGTLRPCGVWRSAVLLGWSRRVRSRGPLPDVPHCCCGRRAWSGVALSPFSCAPLVPRALAFQKGCNCGRASSRRCRAHHCRHFVAPLWGSAQWRVIGAHVRPRPRAFTGAQFCCALARSGAHVCREFAALLGGLAEEGRRTIRIRGRGDARRERDDNDE